MIVGFVPTSGIKARFAGFTGYLGSINKAAVEVLPADMEAQTKAELNKKAHSAVILFLDNKILREVIRETTAAGVKFKDEDLALLLPTSLPASYKHFVDTLLYGREDLTSGDVIATLNSKEIKERYKTKGDDGEGLYVRERTDRRDSRQSRRKSRSKSRGGRLKCYICQSEDHLKRKCPKNNRKKSTGHVKKDEQPSSSDSTYDDSEVMSAQALLDWIMYSRCSYHMTPRYIPELKRNLISLRTLEKEGFTIKLQSGKVKVINGSRVDLSGIRRDNCVYSLDGHAREGELNPSVEEKYSLAQEGMVLYPQSGFPKTFWAEATCTTVNLINRSPSTAIEKKTPMDMWSGYTSDYEMLRISGYVAYPHDKQGKLEPRTVKCVLLRYPEGVRGYRLYRLDDESPKIVTSRNVVFNESVMYKDTLKDSGAGAGKSVEELQVEVKLQRLNNHTLEED
ncbi:retrotransposon protein, putative, ty1-copia subclass [Tanacetum coccineum]